MSNLADFTRDGIQLARDTLNERRGKTLGVQQADTELRITKVERELIECPALYWQ